MSEVKRDSWQQLLKTRNQDSEAKPMRIEFKGARTKEKNKSCSAWEKENKCSLEAVRWLKSTILSTTIKRRQYGI